MRSPCRNKRFSLVLSICLLSIATANAGVLFEQPSRFPRHVCDCWPSTRGANGSESQSFDDFTVDETALITEIQWQGIYWDDRAGNESLNPVGADTEHWQLEVYQSGIYHDRDAPSTPIATQVFEAQRVRTTLLGDYPLGDLISSHPGEFDFTVHVYDFHVVLDEPIEVQADTKYWFSALSESRNYQPQFMWSVSDLTGKSMQKLDSQYYIRNNNFVFSLFKLDGDFNHDSALDQTDIDLLIEQMETGQLHTSYDLNLDQAVDQLDFSAWVHDYKKTWFGDSNLDREFNSRDLVDVFVTGKYETGVNANWSEGDWNADGLFNTRDLVFAFQDGGYEAGPRDAVLAVPEPHSQVLLLTLSAGVIARWRRRSAPRPTGFAWFVSRVVLWACVFGCTTCPLRAQVLLEADFDELPVGTAPSDRDPVGGWQFYDHVITTNEVVDGAVQYTDRKLYSGEAFAAQVSIVEAVTVDPSRDGNVLCISDGVSAFQVYHRFAFPVHEQPDKLIRASFEVFSMNREGAAGAFMIFSGDGGSGGWASNWNRGPQLHFSETSLRSYGCASPSCRFYQASSLVDDYPDDVWQTFQLDIDLVSDSYDLFWSVEGSELSQIGDDLPFRAGDIDELDRLSFAYFNEDGFPNASDLLIFFDNLRVELVDVAPTVPEPSSGVMTLFALLVFTRGRRTTG